MTIAKDVKIQVEFNPAKVASYRLIGYENRMLQAEDFNDDKKDAGEIGAGHTVTALYEIVPPGQGGGRIDAGRGLAARQAGGRGRRPSSLDRQAPLQGARRRRSKLIEQPGRRRRPRLRRAPRPTSGSPRPSPASGCSSATRPTRGRLTYAGLVELASARLGDDPGGYRKEFLDLVRKAQAIVAR